jgi:predicted nucleotidyltransferase
MSDSLKALPENVRTRLEDLKTALEKALGDELVGILVHGSVARGEYHAGESDVDVVIVLAHARLGDLRAIGNAVRLARYAARIEAMILTEDEIQGASDAFPLLYDEIKHHHIVVAGRDPFASVPVLDRHRRLRIEQELREAQIRLRRAVTDVLDDKDALATAVLRKSKQIRSPLAALLALKNKPIKPDLASVLAAAGSLYGVATDKIASAREAPDVAHGALTDLLAKAIDDVNALEEKS